MQIQSEYWDNYYSKSTFEVPSPFCEYVIKKYLQKSDSVIEIGCGDGRDGIEISKYVHMYIGIDKSVKAITAANEKLERLSFPSNLKEFKSASFEELDLNLVSTPQERLVVYSRFSLHADNESVEDKFFETLKKFNEGPLLVLIEVRTIYDELCGVGEMVGKNAYVSDHYRRFIDPKEYLSKLERSFKLIEFKISRGLARYKDEDPMVLRVAFENI